MAISRGVITLIAADSLADINQCTVDRQKHQKNTIFKAVNYTALV